MGPAASSRWDVAAHRGRVGQKSGDGRTGGEAPQTMACELLEPEPPTAGLRRGERRFGENEGR